MCFCMGKKIWTLVFWRILLWWCSCVIVLIKLNSFNQLNSRYAFHNHVYFFSIVLISFLELDTTQGSLKFNIIFVSYQINRWFLTREHSWVIKNILAKCGFEMIDFFRQRNIMSILELIQKEHLLEFHCRNFIRLFAFFYHKRTYIANLNNFIFN